MAELLCALGGGGLQGERTKPAPDLVLDVPCTLDLECDSRELELGAMAPPLELPESGSLLDDETKFGNEFSS